MIQKSIHITSWGVSVLLLVAAVGLLIVATPFFGNSALIVRSGSMEPTIRVGDLVVIKPASEYLVGDVISFTAGPDNKTVITHRVSEVKDGVYQTKGDANSEPDNFTVETKHILGRQWTVVPFIGKVLALAKTRAGFLSLIIVPALAVVLSELRIILREMRKPQTTLVPGAVANKLMPSVEPPLPVPEFKFIPQSRSSPRPWRPLVLVDSISRPLVLFLAAALFMTQSTLALFSDTATSTGNVFAASENFGVSAGDVVINEVMWMGTIGVGGGATDEWLELRNMTNEVIDLTGWEIVNAGSGVGTPVVLSGTIPASGFWLLSRSVISSSAISDTITADHVASGLSLSNGGEQLTLRDASDVVIDQTPADDWPAGSNTGGDRKSMSRNDPPGDGTLDSNWHTCIDAGCNDTTYWDATEGNNYGTPKGANL